MVFQIERDSGSFIITAVVSKLGNHGHRGRPTATNAGNFLSGRSHSLRSRGSPHVFFEKVERTEQPVMHRAGTFAQAIVPVFLFLNYSLQ